MERFRLGSDDGAASRIAVDPSGNPWVVNGINQIFRRSNGSWLRIPGRARDIGIGADGSVWIIGAQAGILTNSAMWGSGSEVDGSVRGYLAAALSGGDAVYRWNGSGWDRVEGSGVRIAVDPTGNAWIINRTAEIFQFVAGSWRRLPGSAIDIGIGAEGSVWVVGSEVSSSGQGNSVFRWNGVDGWRWVPGAALSVSVGRDGEAWIADKAQRIFRLG